MSNWVCRVRALCISSARYDPTRSAVFFPSGSWGTASAGASPSSEVGVAATSLRGVSILYSSLGELSEFDLRLRTLKVAGDRREPRLGGLGTLEIS